jgi:nondiscriminating aspartyl-tRNA synthetase
MNDTTIAELSKHIGKTASVRGWLHKRRDLGGMVFVVLRDRTGIVQAVVKDEAEQAKLAGLQNGTVLSIKGKVTEELRAAGGVELHEPVLHIIMPVTDVMPIEIDKPLSHNSENFDTLFDNRVVGLRNLNERAIFRVQAAVGRAFREFFDERGFTEVHTPKLLPGATRVVLRYLKPITLAKWPPWRRARSFTSSKWWACLSGCMRWGRCIGLSLV